MKISFFLLHLALIVYFSLTPKYNILEKKIFLGNFVCYRFVPPCQLGRSAEPADSTSMVAERTCIMEALTERPFSKGSIIASLPSAVPCVQQYVRKEKEKEVPWSSWSNIVMWRRVVLALRVPPPPPCQGAQQPFLLEPQHILHPRLSLFLSTSPPIFCAAAASIEKLDPNPPFAYYEILHIPRHANQSQVVFKVWNWVITCCIG